MKTTPLPANVKRRRARLQGVKLQLLDRVKSVLSDLKSYWPLTLRQVYYQLVAGLVVENRPREYKKLSDLLSRGRLAGLIPWEAFEDRSRQVLRSEGWTDREEFVQYHLARFLAGYRRDLLQTQPKALEVWVEKDALSHVCHRAARPYCVPVIVARGFSSISYVHECRKRVEAAAQRGQRTQILYFGDLDPSGWEMLPAMLETLQSEMGLGDQVEGIRCALTPAQVENYGLPRNPEALKETDSRAKKYRAQFGDLAVELDALAPSTLEALVRQSIEAHLDLSAFQQEQQQQEAERPDLSEWRESVLHYFTHGRG